MMCEGFNTPSSSTYSDRRSLVRILIAAELRVRAGTEAQETHEEYLAHKPAISLKFGESFRRWNRANGLVLIDGALR